MTAGSCLNIKIVFSVTGDFQYKKKTVMRLSYRYNGNTFNSKKASLYSDDPRSFTLFPLRSYENANSKRSYYVFSYGWDQSVIHDLAQHNQNGPMGSSYDDAISWKRFNWFVWIGIQQSLVAFLHSNSAICKSNDLLLLSPISLLNKQVTDAFRCIKKRI